MYTEVLEAWKRLENSLVSFNAVGLAVDEEALAETQCACDAAAELVVSMAPAFLAALRCGREEVQSVLLALVAKFKASARQGPLALVCFAKLIS